MPLKKYRKKAGQSVQAIQLNLDTDGFDYRKWGDTQHCKAGDWLVDNGGDIYTVDQQTFADTYLQIAPATFEKTTAVWARVANADGNVETKEGHSHYQAGDYIVSNNKDGSDAWCVSAGKFDEMYEPVEDV